MALVLLVRALVTGHRDLLGVDDDDEVARVHVRRALGLVLAAQGVGDLGREAAEREPVRVDEHPVALAEVGMRNVGLHEGTRNAARGPSAARRGAMIGQAPGPPPPGQPGSAMRPAWSACSRRSRRATRTSRGGCVARMRPYSPPCTSPAGSRLNASRVAAARRSSAGMSARRPL